jgi:Zn-dependent protease
VAEAAVAARRCAACGTELADVLLACPACARFVHAEELGRLAASAHEKEQAGDAAGALALWQRALELLPSGTRQREAVAATVARLSANAPPPPAAVRPAPQWLRKLGPIGVAILAVWKLVGVAKVAAFLSLIASFALYWRTWGLAFGGGFLASIYLHELGHVAALRWAGIPASPPMFIPGVGAYVRMHRAPADPRTDALVGLAGPIAGLATALAFHLAWLATGLPLLRALAHAGAIINLFNLVPIWSLDGARGLAPLARWQRFLLLAVFGALWATTREGMLVLILLVGFFQAFSPRAPQKGDTGILALFSAVSIALGLLAFYASGS